MIKSVHFIKMNHSLSHFKRKVHIGNEIRKEVKVSSCFEPLLFARFYGLMGEGGK